MSSKSKNDETGATQDAFSDSETRTRSVAVYPSDPVAPAQHSDGLRSCRENEDASVAAHPGFPDDDWTLTDDAMADAEGWNIYDAGGELEIECNDVNTIQTARQFSDDDEAIEFVRERAQAGSTMHVRALAIHEKYLRLSRRSWPKDLEGEIAGTFGDSEDSLLNAGSERCH